MHAPVEQLESPVSCSFLKFCFRDEDKGTDLDDRLLVEIVHPLVFRVVQEGPADYYFFMRYQDQDGYHLRVRFFTQGSDHQERFKEIDESRLIQELEEPLKSWPVRLKADKYEPEWERYGGEPGVRASERLFHSSSNAVLNFLRFKSSRPEKLSKLEFAITSLESMFQALKLAPEQRIQTIRSYAPLPKEMVDSLRQNLSPALIEQISGIVESASRDPIGHWQEVLQEIGGIIKDFEKEVHELLPILRTERVLSKVKTRQKDPFVNLCSSYVHMHLNRLALFPAEEVLLRAFLLRAF